jgi:signal transduction histidine kinase
MRSLATTLTLAFLLVGLTGAFLVAFFVYQHTQSQFDQLIANQSQDTLVNSLIQYYQQNGSWHGVEVVFHPGTGAQAPNQGNGPPFLGRRDLFTLVDANGVIVFGGGRLSVGQHLNPANRKSGVPLKKDNQTVGWLIFTPGYDRWNPGTPEGRFLLSVNQATFYSAIGAAFIALILGGILAYTLTRSLRELTAATKLLAKGELGHQVKVRTQDELGVLAGSFNQMSSELARSNELRRQMTADVAHDLRTPLSVILGYTEALNDGKFSGSPEIFSVMHREALHLNHLIEDLKTLSLADAGELPLVRTPVPPLDLLRRTAAAHQIKADKEGVTIQVNAPADLPLINVDVERMSQVLNNLVSNALRYTQLGGKIGLSADVLDGATRLRVADNGRGIAPEALPFVFERSFRGEKSRSQESSEAGLGLAISRSLVEAHGGTISVESALGKGTTFTITL